jgi:uncharacterized protein YbjT (DUF2867 family)
VKKILVLGGTGMLGEPVARRLKDDGFDVRLLARNPEKTRALFDGSFEIVTGDVTDAGSLEKALEGCSGAHVSVGGPVDQLSAENVASLGSRLGLERITYISGSTVFEQNRWFPMVEQKLEAENAIRECGVSYTIFCPTWPMEQLPRFARDGKPFLLGKQPAKYHWFAAEDLAHMVSSAYRDEEAAGKRFFIHGPEAMTMKEALERYCRVFYPDAKPVSVMPIWLAKTIAKLTANKDMQAGASIMGYFDKVQEMGDPGEANAILGAPEITLDEWMNKRRSQTAATS